MEWLSTGGEDQLLPKLVEAINQANRIDMSVAFVRMTGLALLFEPLRDALSRGASVRILTSDYLNYTDAQALRALLILAEEGAETRIFVSDGQSFHMKAYLFTSSANGWGCAYVGSSNVSRSALLDGLEWNIRIDQSASPSVDKQKLTEISRKFDLLWQDSRNITISHEWVDEYQKRVIPKTIVEPGAVETLDLPKPHSIQEEALKALVKTRNDGYERGLVVLATGVGKTWLAAFDAVAFGAEKVLFVAHREEILMQAESSFLRVWPSSKVGRYTGKEKQVEVDLLFASVQTLGRSHHLEQFDKNHFDYIVVDEFHHASAQTYRALLSHFQPKFLLGLTATPERSDQADILSLCDDNLVYSFDLFSSVEKELLCPFHYYGILDETVDYKAIPWRNGKFDPETLSNKLATLGRAKHAFGQWKQHAQARTLGFCVSKSHADYMARFFEQQGVSAIAVHSSSEMPRNSAIAKLEKGEASILFTVDLFNEGVDIPAVDTVMMLRPTESKILFLQQLGRGLRTYQQKTHLVVLDFVANHHGFLNKPVALFSRSGSKNDIRDLGRALKKGEQLLPRGCYVNIDLRFIEFLCQLGDQDDGAHYTRLKATLGRRPSLREYFESGGAVSRLRSNYGAWWKAVEQFGDLDDQESLVLRNAEAFFSEIEITDMKKSYKMILLEAFSELDGWSSPPDLPSLASRSLGILKRRPRLHEDLPVQYRGFDPAEPGWEAYWKKNPVNAFTSPNNRVRTPFFRIENNLLKAAISLPQEQAARFVVMLQEIIDFRLAQYDSQKASSIELAAKTRPGTALSFYPNIRVACGHFKTGNADEVEYRVLSENHGRLDPARHFIARASGNSMNGGKNPIRDGDYLLLEAISSQNAGSLTGKVVLIERQDMTGTNEYLLRQVNKTSNGEYRLHAFNPDYPDIQDESGFRTFARLREVLSPFELNLHEPFMREEVPSLFGMSFNVGLWQSGHVSPAGSSTHILFVTLNKQGKAVEHQYHDRFVSPTEFCWHTQNSVSPDSAKGRAIVDQKNLGAEFHLFVRRHKLQGKKAAPFWYLGQIEYMRHINEKPMDVTWRLETPIPSELWPEFSS